MKRHIDWKSILILAFVGLAYGLAGRDELDEQIARENEMKRAEIFEPAENLTKLHHPCESLASQKTTDREPWKDRCARASQK